LGCIAPNNRRPLSNAPICDKAIANVGISLREGFRDGWRLALEDDDCAVCRICKCPAKEELASVHRSSDESEVGITIFAPALEVIWDIVIKQQVVHFPSPPPEQMLALGQLADMASVVCHEIAFAPNGRSLPISGFADVHHFSPRTYH
jgi:hypothetical protein